MRALFGFLLLLSFTGHFAAQAKDYKGGELRTKEAYVYGRFEARYKPPKGSGMLASFFTYHEIQTSAEWNEIDFEILGRYDHDVLVTSIQPGQKFINSHQWVPFKPHEDFHTYAFEWTPDYIAWFIDGKEVHRQTGNHIPLFRFPQKIMMNIWPPDWEPWAGHLDDRTLPLFAYYDWVSYCSYTPGNGDTGTDNNFTLIWKDEFDSWDQTRWEKATHTFGGNNADFIPENVVFKDGHMILCLTNSLTLGFNDKTAPSVLWVRGHNNRIILGFSEAIDSLSAMNLNNYRITDLPLSNPRLYADQRTVELQTGSLASDQEYNLVVWGIKDRATPANKLTGQVLTVTVAKQLEFPIKINVGGPAFGDFIASQVWSPELEHGHQDGYAGKFSPVLDVLGTEQDEIYRTQLHELVEYKVRVPNGWYDVTLMMAENSFKNVDERVFAVQIENQPVIDRIDLVKDVGVNTAIEITKQVMVSDEILDIHLTNLKNFSLLNGIIIDKANTGVSSESTISQPKLMYLAPNYPNPFNSSTTISYEIFEPGHVDIIIYDVGGRQIEQLVQKTQSAGRYQLLWNPNVPSGIYFSCFRFKSQENNYTQTRKMVLLR